MNRFQVKKLLKLEAQLQNELKKVYTECMLDLFPMIDVKHAPIPSKKKVTHNVEQRLHAQYPALKDSKILSSVISKYVSKKYEVKK